MNKRIVALCSFSALVSLGASGLAHSATSGPVSSMSESTAQTAPGTTQAVPSAASTQATPAQAAPVQTAPATTTGTLQSSDVSDEQLQKFVASAQQVAVLSQEYSQQLQGVQDQSQQQRVVQEANGKMAEAIQANGLTVQEFNGISEAVDEDPELNARARQMLQ